MSEKTILTEEQAEALRRLRVVNCWCSAPEIGVSEDSLDALAQMGLIGRCVTYGPRVV